MYVFSEILHIETLANCESAMAFEIIGFLLLIYFVIGNLLFKRTKAVFFTIGFCFALHLLFDINTYIFYG